jgi:3-oxoacyl-[acyl-carrier-protein] synthase-3
MGAVVQANTSEHDLCRSQGLTSVMNTDSERLLQEGVATGNETFARFLDEMAWGRRDIDKTVCHQVGAAHQKLLFETLDLPPAIDFATLPRLGNTGAAALPVTMAIGAQLGFIARGDRLAMLGIGSGIHCLMMGVRWQMSQVGGSCDDDFVEAPSERSTTRASTD